jgi:acyl-coenzyme A thioesterase PaaI-like protein
VSDVTSDAPDRQVRWATDLDVVLDQPTAERSIATVPVTDAVRDASGAAAIGFLVTVADSCASVPALCAVVPDWTVTADLSLHELAPLVRGPAVLESRLVRAGARLVTIAVDVFEGAGVADPADVADPVDLARVATGTVSFARVALETSDVGHLADPLGDIGTRRHWMNAEALSTEPLVERCGISVVDATNGVVELPNSDYVHNSRGQVGGGVLGVVFQAAAEAAHRGFTCSDVAIHFLAGARVGPVRTRGFVVRESSDHVVRRVEAVDAGADDRLVAQATITLQRVER